MRPSITKGFVYTDCRVDDARLVVLNARAAASKGALILTRTRLVAARRVDGEWDARLLGEREVGYMRDHEWAETADDVLWRRSKCGLHMTADQRHAVAAYMDGHG